MHASGVVWRGGRPPCRARHTGAVVDPGATSQVCSLQDRCCSSACVPPARNTVFPAEAEDPTAGENREEDEEEDGPMPWTGQRGRSRSHACM